MAGTNQKAARRMAATQELAAAATQLIERLGLPVEQPTWQKDQEIADLQRLEYSGAVMVAAVEAVGRDWPKLVRPTSPIRIPDPDSEIQYEKAQPIPEPASEAPEADEVVTKHTQSISERRLPRREGRQ